MWSSINETYINWGKKNPTIGISDFYTLMMTNGYNDDDYH